MSSDLRTMIRELLREELAARGVGRPSGATQIREEAVSVASDAELAAFARRILALAGDSKARADIENGRHVFRLAGIGSRVATPVEAYERAQPKQNLSPVSFERGLVNEREIRNLPEGITVIRIGKTVRLTPLAQDELRRLGIKIERAKS
ncbi:hypothetical protein [Mesorhizobium sp. A556]